MNKCDVSGTSAHPIVLVVDDENAVLYVIQQILSRQGITVIPASSPQDALLLWEKHRDKVDMVLTDLFFNQGSNGKDLVMKLLQHRPDLPVILASGDICDIETESWLTQNQAQFLMKPFRAEELLVKVKAGLGINQRPRL